jgi:hypothetical protein
MRLADQRILLSIIANINCSLVISEVFLNPLGISSLFGDEVESFYRSTHDRQIHPGSGVDGLNISWLNVWESHDDEAEECPLFQLMGV